MIDWAFSERNEEEVDADDVIAFLNANNDAKGLGDNAPAQSGAEAPDVLAELGGDGMSLG